MRSVLLQLLEDFLSAIVFAVMLLLTHQLALATGLAIAIALGQFAYGMARKRAGSAMRWMVLALAIGLGCLTLLTHDSRYMQLKPTVAHVAIAAVMLKRGWLQAYLPPLAQQWLPPPVVIGWGYAWAGLMLAMGIVNAAAARWLSVGAWGALLTGLLLGKVLFGVVQYFAMRRTVVRRMVAQAAANAG